MNLLSIENLAKNYGERVLFSDINFGIDEGDKIGLIGVNGTGKSTLLKVIAGVLEPDSGQVIKGNSVRVAYLPQLPEFEDNATVLSQVFFGGTPEMKALREYQLAMEMIGKHPGDSKWEQKMIKSGQQIDTLGAWQLESEAKSILTKLGITNYDSLVNELSGGQRKRVALARTLITPADLLILDEPTNHIDNDTVAWLEDYLAKRKGALIMITHDRYFLDRVANRAVELDRGRLYTYSGNYSAFLELKAAREELLEANERKRQNLLRTELAWIRRGAQARSTKQKARIERFEQLSAERPELSDAKIEMAVGASRLGKKIIEIDKLSHSFDGRQVIDDFSYIVLKNDRLGIVGPNGSGKSTLLNIIAGKLLPESGTVDVGQTVKIGYFSQENTELDERMRVIDYIKEEANFLPTADGGEISASQMLERFLFSPQLQYTPIAKLSGGEKRRLYLLRVLMGAPNVLLLDEPTNDLDIQTLTILEDYLDDFPGAVIAVSHDRYFLDKVADKIFAFEGNGLIKQYNGGYTDYREKWLAMQVSKSDKVKKTEDKKPDPGRKKERPRKLSFKEQREFDEIEGVIAGVEQQLAGANAAINNAGSNFELLQKLTREQQELEERLNELLDRWTYLNELVEEMEAK